MEVVAFINVDSLSRNSSKIESDSVVALRGNPEVRIFLGNELKLLVLLVP